MLVKKYLKDTSGNFAMMFAIGAMAILAGVGAAIDYNGMTRNTSYLQNLADAGALAASTSKEKAVGQLQKIAKDHVDAHNTLGAPIATNLEVVNDVIVVKTESVYNTHLMGIFGKSKFDLSAVARSPLNNDTPISVALVLDRTGSMQGANMNALKDASKGMIDTFETYEANIKASVVPFSQYVNVGLANRNVSWMDVPNDSSTPGAEVCKMKRDITNPGLCRTQKVPSTCNNDGVTYACTKTIKTCPAAAYGPEYEHCYTPTNNLTWNGCAGSRNQPLNKNPHYDGKKIPGIMNVSCGQEMLPLTSNMITVENKINSLTASGNTYIPAGLIWGWRTLEASKPFDDITNADTKRKKAVVLMTDGKNTKSLTGNTHNGSDEGAANALTSEICSGIKSGDIEVYSVAYKFGSGDATAKNVVRNCATDPSFFFDAQNPEQLKDAFEDIAKSLFTVRLSG